MFPSELVLDRSVRSGDLAATDLPLFILKCEDRKAEGYADADLKVYNQRLQGMVIGVRLASKPPAVSYLTIIGAELSGEIVAVEEAIIVISIGFTCEGATPWSYLIYDAAALSLRLIPPPKHPSWRYTLSSQVSLARPAHGSASDYALVHSGRLGARGEDAFFLWRPSSTSPPWSEFKKFSLLHRNGWSETSPPFSFSGQTYRVDHLQGVFCYSCDAFFDDKSSSVLRFTPLPVEPRDFDERKAEPDAYRTMGVVRDSFIKFISINGIHEYAQLKDRTVTVWKLLDLGHDKLWEMEHEFSMEKLWGFEGFGDVPKDLTPMYPLLSTKDTNIVYLGLGYYRETRIVRGPQPPEWDFLPYYPRYMLAVDMRNKIVRTSVKLEGNKPTCLVSCGFSRYLRKALVLPCDDEGVPIPKKKKKKKPRRDGEDVAKAPISMNKKPRLEKPICC
ncbi:unnamed protein product [Alopecurus aequalis]